MRAKGKDGWKNREAGSRKWIGRKNGFIGRWVVESQGIFGLSSDSWNREDDV